jgi:1,4-alpha-glucan branching enzyme
MNTTQENLKTSRYSARHRAKPVNFYLAAPQAKSVSLAGDFNEWNPHSHPLQRRSDGWWYLQAALTHGHHQYYFVVDGRATLDKRASGTATNQRGEPVSLVAVS